MKKSNKIMSLLLAFVMVFSAFVPAFAAEDLHEKDGNSQDGAPKNVFVFKFDETLNGLEAQNKLVTLYRVEAEKTDLQKVTDNSEHKDYLEVEKSAIKAGETYYLVYGQLTAVNQSPDNKNASKVEEGTNFFYKFTATKDATLPTVGEDSNGIKINPAEMVEKGEYFKWVQAIEKEDDLYRFKVYSQLGNRDIVPNLSFEIVTFKLTADGKDYATVDGHRVADKALKVVDNLKTDDRGFRGFTMEELVKLVNAVPTVKVADGKDAEGDIKYKDEKVVGFRVNGVVVAIADLLADTHVIITPIPDVTELRVTVVGLDGMVAKDGKKRAPKAIEGATVELQPNETEIWKAPEFGKAIDTQKTNAKGVAVFENPEMSTILNVLYPVPVMKDGKATGEFTEEYTNLSLANKVVVTTAEGFKVPVSAMLEKPQLKEVTKGVYEITIELLPVDVSYNHRIAGLNRYATSVEVAKEAFEEKVQKHVIIASGDNYADALTANGLVGIYEAPLVLNGANKLDPAVKEYLKDSKTETVTIVGGPTTITGAVTDELLKMNIKTTRVYGQDRFETSVNVLKYLSEKKEMPIEEVFLTSGRNFADALVASVPSALKATPILLTEPNSLPEVVKETIRVKDDDINIKNVIIVGGEKSVSEGVKGAITNTSVERLFGDNRQLTSMAVARRYFLHAGRAIVVNGQVYADALSAGQLGWKYNAPILLAENADNLGEDVADYLAKMKMTEITIVGGEKTVTSEVDKEIYEAITNK